MPADINLVDMVIQGGALAAFFWLVIDTRKESARREEKLMGAFDVFGSQLREIAVSLAKMCERLDAMDVK